LRYGQLKGWPLVKQYNLIKEKVKKIMAVKKIRLKILSDLFRDTLEAEINKLPVPHRRPVEIIQSVNQFRITNSFGVYGIIPIGGDFTPPENPDAIIQNHDVAMGVIVGMRPILDHPRPVEYVEFAIDALTGLYLENNRPERRVSPAKWEPMEERWENDEWWYRIIFNGPIDHYEKRFEEQLLNH
jgi:hypothetical protein